MGVATAMSRGFASTDGDSEAFMSTSMLQPSLDDAHGSRQLKQYVQSPVDALGIFAQLFSIPGLAINNQTVTQTSNTSNKITQAVLPVRAPPAPNVTQALNIALGHLVKELNNTLKETVSRLKTMPPPPPPPPFSPPQQPIFDWTALNNSLKQFGQQLNTSLTPVVQLLKPKPPPPPRRPPPPPRPPPSRPPPPAFYL
eukprot:jgi/Chrzof1/11660/Cz06g04050.t1